MASVPEQTPESCGDECLIDLSKMKKSAPAEGQDGGPAYLILLTRGTYGHHDDGFSAIQVGNAILAEEEQATLLLLDDGVYFAVKGQNSSSLGLPNYVNYIEDFLDLGGRILVLETSLKKRGVAREDLVDGVQVIGPREMVTQVERHHVSVTF